MLPTARFCHLSVLAEEVCMHISVNSLFMQLAFKLGSKRKTHVGKSAFNEKLNARQWDLCTRSALFVAYHRYDEVCEYYIYMIVSYDLRPPVQQYI